MESAPASAPAVKTSPLLTALTLPVIFGLAVVQFLVTVQVALWFGNPGEVPAWLRPLDVLLGFDLTTALRYLTAFAWMAVVALLALLVYAPGALVLAGGDWLLVRAGKPRGLLRAYGVAAKKLWLLLSVMIITLLLIPLEAFNRLYDGAWIEAGLRMGYVDFTVALAQSSFMVFMVFILGTVLVGVVSIFIKVLPDRNDGCGWQLVLAIVVALAVTFGIALAFAPLLAWIETAAGGLLLVGAMFALYAALSLMISLLAGLVSRRRRTGP